LSSQVPCEYFFGVLPEMRQFFRFIS